MKVHLKESKGYIQAILIGLAFVGLFYMGTM